MVGPTIGSDDVGMIFAAKCLDCGKSFELVVGGGMHHYLLRCDTCGKETGIPHEAGPDVAVIESVAGRCECGGKFKVDAPPRCPQCRSLNIEKGEQPGWID